MLSTLTLQLKTLGLSTLSLSTIGFALIVAGIFFLEGSALIVLLSFKIFEIISEIRITIFGEVKIITKVDTT